VCFKDDLISSFNVTSIFKWMPYGAALGLAQALLENIRLGRIDFPGSNALAYLSLMSLM